MSLRWDLPLGNGRKVVAVFAPIRLSRGVAATALSLPVELTAEWLGSESRDSAAVLFSGFVRMGNQAPQLLGWLAPQVFMLRGYRTTEELSLLLTDDQLAAVDERCNGESLELLVDLFAQDISTEQSRFPHSQVQAPLRVSRSEWLALVDQLGGDIAMTIRVPSPLTDAARPAPRPDADTTASKAQTAARLRQARRQLLDGMPEQCAATSRLVLDNLAALTPPASVSELSAKSPRTRSIDERWDALRHDLASLLSVAHHDDDVTRGVTWSRVDAEASLAMVAAIASRFMRLA